MRETALLGESVCVCRWAGGKWLLVHSALTHDWSWVHSEQRCTIWLTDLCTQVGITSKPSACCRADKSNGFYTLSCKCQQFGPPGEGRVDLEGEASFTLLPSHENTQTKTNDSVYSLPSNPATWNAEKNSFCREKSVSEALNRWKTKVFVIMCHRVSVKTDLSSNIKCWNQFFAGISSCAVSICLEQSVLLPLEG